MDEKPPPPRVFDLLAIGLASAIMIGGALGIGVAIDAWLHSSPIGALVGLGIGIVAAVGATVRQVRRFL